MEIHLKLQLHLFIINVDLSISPKGIIDRDELVFEQAFKNKIPILMVLSGGYQMINAPTIADSIENLNRKFDLLKRYEERTKM